MPQFSWRGRNISGGEVSGVLEGADPGSVAEQLAATGVIPLDIAPAPAGAVGGQASAAGGFMERLREGAVTHMDLLLFSRQMYTLLKAGVPILRALTGLQESTASKPFARVIGDIRENLDSGRDLSASLARRPDVFGPFYVSMVRVGEGTGALEEVFLRLFDHLEFQRLMRDQVKSAVRYPTFVLIAMVIAVLIINLLVIPEFAKVYKGFGKELPFLTQVLIGVSGFMREHWIAVVGGLVGAAAGFLWWIGSEHGRPWWDRNKLKIPIAGKIILKATLARFARSFALAQRSGVPVVQGLSLVAQVVDNHHIGGRIEEMRRKVERGDSILRSAAATGIFTPVVLQMIMVGEESGALDDLMQEVADLYQREVEYDLKTLSSQIEPILTVAMGILVLILALGVFLPIWDLGQAVLKK